MLIFVFSLSILSTACFLVQCLESDGDESFLRYSDSSGIPGLESNITDASEGINLGGDSKSNGTQSWVQFVKGGSNSVFRGGSDGIEAKPGEFPYMIWTNTKLKPFGNLPCAGVLISPEWVLTDATCVKFYNPKKGIIPIFDGVSPDHKKPRPKMYNAVKKIAHEGFRWIERRNAKLPGTNNIGLLQLSEPVPMKQGFTPVKLPPAGPFTGTDRLLMPSWGQNSRRRNHKTLRYTKLEIHDLAWCKNYEKKENGIKYFATLGGKMICNNPAQYSLRLDLSAPLIKKGKKPSEDVVIGVQSLDFQFKAGRPMMTIFIDVGAHRDWIKKHTGL